MHETHYQHVFATFMQIVQAISVVIALGEQEVWHDAATLEIHEACTILCVGIPFHSH